jgi:Leucine-rich repeat (LRR) protein
MERSTVIVALGAVLGLACTDRSLPVAADQPMAHAATAALPACDDKLAKHIRDQIVQLFPKGKALLQAAQSQFDNIVRTCQSDRAGAQTKALAFTAFTLAKYQNRQLTRAATPSAVAAFLSDVLAYVGLGSEGAVTVVQPSTTVQTVTTGDGQAGASFPPGAVSQPVVVSITPSADQTDPLPTGLTQFPPFYDFVVSPAVTFAQPVTIGICVEYGTASQDVLDRLHLARPDAATGGTTIELLPRVAAPSLSCPPLPGLTAMAPAERGRLLGRLLAGAVALLQPAPLHAETMRLLQVGTVGGLGGTVTSFTGGSTGTVESSAACANVTEIPALECEALVALYDSTDGPNWAVNTNWLQTTEPCSWYGVGCGDGMVLVLFLKYNRLHGVIPPELGNLSALLVMELDSNQLSGPIPATIGALSNLRVLTLGFNSLSGELPATLGNLTSLDTLAAASNQLTGGIPGSLGNLTTNLRFLELASNQLSGPIPPELGNLGNLLDLDVARNQLSGAIPAALGMLGNLGGLELDGNQLSGAIPAELGNLGQLRFLSVSSNALSGDLPAGLGNLTNLVFLDASHNQLTGGLAVLANLHALQVLYMHSNQLAGTIPSELGTMANLQVLHLASNQLTGPIPAALGNLNKLTSLQIDDNQLTGAIPGELGNLTKLFALRLELNQLSGLIPLSVAQVGGKILSGNCTFVPGNSGIYMPNTAEYLAADLDHDGFICGVGFTP